MITIYYPHIDLQNKGLLQGKINHSLNIKLLLLLADQVLILPSHMIDANYQILETLNRELFDFFLAGKIVGSIYANQANLNEYFREKSFFASTAKERTRIQVQADYIQQNLFENPILIKRDNTAERDRFQVVFNDINHSKIENTKNYRLVKAVKIFEESFYSQKEQENHLLSIQDVQFLIEDLLNKKKIARTHVSFFNQNMIGAYYYCGSFANNAITAYNPYFSDISFNMLSEHTPYRSTEIYKPEFLLNILLGLKIIDSPDDFGALQSSDYDIIKKHKAWCEFVRLYNELQENATVLEKLIEHEQGIKNKIDKAKSIVFDLLYGFADLAVSSLIGLIIQGFFGLAIGIALMVVGAFFSNSKTSSKLQYSTSDRFIERIISSKEPMYVVNSRLRGRIDGFLK